MHEPMAIKLAHGGKLSVFRINLDPRVGSELVARNVTAPPAVLIVRNAMPLVEQDTAVIDAQDIVAAFDGDWSRAFLLVAAEQESGAESVASAQGGDNAFLAHVEQVAPALTGLAEQTLERIRAAGIEGRLHEASKGRWVNRPANSFTLKVQPRAGNLHFTIYGNPSAFDAPGFLRQDQNSYSRGWVRNLEDAEHLARLVRQAHSRRVK